MKSKIRENKSDNTVICDYHKVKNPFEFRYKVLSRLIKSDDSVVMFIDTNTRTKKPEKRMEAYFDTNNIEYSMFKIGERQRKVLGMVLNIVRKPKPKLTEKFIIAKIKTEDFTKEFFDDCLATYDIALGFDPKVTIEKMVSDYRENVQDIFFDNEFFKDFIYDSILFTSLRSTKDVKDIVAESE